MNTEEAGRGAAPAFSGERRATLLRLAGLCGLALSGDALAALAAPKPAAGLLAPDALALTAVLAELIIPRTDTPGALAVGAHHTISHLLRACAAPEDQARFLAGLARIDAAARARGGKRFTALAPARQTALLHALDAGKEPFNDEDQRFFQQLKSYTALAYYTSEAGATRELVYLPVPGGYKGDLPLKKNRRNWAL
ncbi:gluconate 2-dehydrogenase subunit 3 family protein [Pseudoduganella namucuonensis]|uniref:Gluconate 2-dehydrogenase subunit 3 n=1 Tax=Pseudoduganella namucuonensis TaxID=1035707 RepID=A0A1I7LNX8_9BURK|nr:gluconate 2-dehydrogenase subunit 3 family protein [Pseudoduganella namucuonensis]SFV11412.1 Gluconate 2-dehydrogenase subunit 3 [Pseudoduganella namucuonensis]